MQLNLHSIDKGHNYTRTYSPLTQHSELTTSPNMLFEYQPFRKPTAQYPIILCITRYIKGRTITQYATWLAAKTSLGKPIQELVPSMQTQKIVCHTNIH